MGVCTDDYRVVVENRGRWQLGQRRLEGHHLGAEAGAQTAGRSTDLILLSVRPDNEPSGATVRHSVSS